MIVSSEQYLKKVKGFIGPKNGISPTDIITKFSNRYGMPITANAKTKTKQDIFDALHTLEFVTKEITFKEGEYFLKNMKPTT